MSINVAILGSGIFAREEHLPAVQAAPTLTLKAVYSRSLKSAQSLGTDSSVDLYSDDSPSPDKSLDVLLARPDIHAVIIALPIKNQPEYIKKALLAGKHVLSEKPVAENVAEAKDLIHWYRHRPRSSTEKPIPTWSVAENFRFLPPFLLASSRRPTLGRALNFRLRMQTLVQGGKYFETSWRKTPTHQGGFLLDGGVHFIAGLRLLLGSDEPLVSISANTAQLQPHLPPVDTIDATARTKGGATGTISISFGTTFTGSEWSVACEKGVVSVRDGKKVKVGDGEEKEVDEGGNGVTAEVAAWGEALKEKRTNDKQSPEEALADLEIIEMCLRSGEQGGMKVELECQSW